MLNPERQDFEHAYCLDGKRCTKTRLSSLYSFPLHIRLGQQEAGKTAQLEEDLSVSLRTHKEARDPHVIPHEGGRDRRVSALLAGQFTLLWHVAGQ